MSFWVYNMGLAVPVSSDSLLAKRNVKSLRELSKTTDFSHSDESTPDLQHSQQRSQKQPPQKPVQSKAIAGYQQQNKTKPQHEPVTFAKQIMSTKIKYLFDDMKLNEAWGDFRQYRYRHFPVVDKNKLIVGILSDRDMLIAAATNKSKTMSIRQVMSQPVLTASANSLIAEVCQIMFNRHIGALPITDEKNKILGLVTRSDILRSMIKHGPVQLWI